MDRLQALPLIEHIYAAALDASRWDGFVHALSSAFGDAPVGFALQLPGFPLSGVFYASDGFRPEFRERYAVHSLRGLPWEEARRNHFVGRFGLASEVISDEQLALTDFYRDWMEPQNLGPHGPMGHTIALDEGRPIAGLAIFPPQGHEPFGSEHLAFGDLLVGHLGLAYRIHSGRRHYQALADAIDRFPTGLVMIDTRGHVVRTNLGANQILEEADGLTLSNHVVHADHPDDDDALRTGIEAVIEAAAASRPIESSVLTVRRPSGRRSYPVVVSPLRADAADAMLEDAVAVLYVSDIASGTLRRREAIRELYQLTEAETQLAELLCQGCSLEEAAETRGVTMNTARSQLKQVFAKTETSRQSELVRLLLTGVGSIAGP